MKSLTLGIDIGGTNTALGLVSSDGKIMAKGSISTRRYSDINSYIDSIFTEASRLCEEAQAEISAIGIGAPCVNQSTGCIDGATDLPWGSHVPIRQLMEDRFGTSARATNDANAAAAGEMVFGAARGLKNFIMLTLGTGVGAGVVCDGHLLGGNCGFAGELGHYTIADGEHRECGCGRYDCLQTYASASGVVVTARKLLSEESYSQSPLAVSPTALTPQAIYHHALEGDPLALKIFAFTGEMLGKAAANFATFSSPEAIILFGGVSGAAEFIFPAMQKAMDENLLHIYKNKIRLLKSELQGADAAILGAAALCGTL